MKGILNEFNIPNTKNINDLGKLTVVRCTKLDDYKAEIDALPSCDIVVLRDKLLNFSRVTTIATITDGHNIMYKGTKIISLCEVYATPVSYKQFEILEDNLWKLLTHLMLNKLKIFKFENVEYIPAFSKLINKDNVFLGVEQLENTKYILIKFYIKHNDKHFLIFKGKLNENLFLDIEFGNTELFLKCCKHILN